MPEPGDQQDPLQEFYKEPSPKDTGVSPQPSFGGGGDTQQDPLAQFYGGGGVKPPSLGGGQQDPLAQFYGGDQEFGVAPSDMAPKVFPEKKDEDRPVADWLPKEVWGIKTTDIPIAGFLLNKKMWEGPTKAEEEQYKPEPPKTYTPLAPFGIYTKVSNDTPIVGGIAEALGQAEADTTPTTPTAGIRDKPLIGEANRVLEAGLNLLNEPFKTVAEPLAGLASIPLRGLTKTPEGLEAIGYETQKGADEALARIRRGGGIDRPTDIISELGAIQEFGRSALVGTPAVYKFVAPIVFDPLSYAGGWVTKAQEAKLILTETKPLAEMSSLERIVTRGIRAAPAEAKEILPAEGLGLEAAKWWQKVFMPWQYTDRANAIELVHNAIGGLITRVHNLDLEDVPKLFTSIKEAAASGNIKPIEDAFPQYARAFQSLEGQKLIRTLEKIDTDMPKTVIGEIQGSIAEAVEAAQRGSLGPKPSQFAKDFFNEWQKGEKVVPPGWNLQRVVEEAAEPYAKAKVLSEATETIGKAAADAFKITDKENLLIKAKETIKSIEANVFIGMSLPTVMGNTINHISYIAAHGLRPFGFSSDTLNMLKVMGMESGSMYAKVERQALRELSKAGRVGGYAGLVRGPKIPSLIGAYQKVYDASKESIWAQGVRHALVQALKVSADSMPENVVRSLSRVDASLPDLVKGALQAGYSPQELSRLIAKTIPVTIESQIPSLAKKMNLTEDVLRTYLHQSEEMGSINEALRTSRTAEEFSAKAQGIVTRLRENVQKFRDHVAETEGHAVAPGVRKATEDVIKEIPKIKGVPTGTIKSVEDLKAQFIPFDQFNIKKYHAHVWATINHFGEPENAVRAVHDAINGWFTRGNQTQRMMESVNKARQQGKIWPEALEEFYQLRANAAYQGLFEKGIKAGKRGYYEKNLRESDALMRTLTNNKKGIDLAQLEHGPIDPRLAWKGKLGTEGKYAKYYSERVTGGLPQVPARRAGGNVPGVGEAGGGVRGVGGAKVPPPQGVGGAVSPSGATAVGGAVTGAADPAIKQALASHPDAALQFWASATGPGSEPYALAARELLAERAGGAAESAAAAPSAAPIEQAAVRGAGGAPVPTPIGGEAGEEARRFVGTGGTAPVPTPITHEGLRNAIQDLRDVSAERAGASGMDIGEQAAARYQVIADTLERMMPDLEGLYASSGKYNEPASEEARRILGDWIQKEHLQNITEAQLAARRIGDWYVQRSILNYQARTHLDDALSWAAPFAYWPRATATNYLMEALNRPALMTNYIRSKELLNSIQEKEGYPSRFKGMIKVPFPGSSLFPYLGGDLFFDPWRDLIPIDKFAQTPAKSLGFLAPKSTDVANEIRKAMQSGSISAAEGEKALKEMKGNQLWDSTLERMAQETKPDALDVGSVIFSPHAPLDWINKAFIQGRPQDIPYFFPFSREIKGGTAMLKSIFPHMAIPSPGIDPEGELRKKFGLPSGDPAGDYYVDRMLASMSLDGSVSPQQARLAMLERKGAVYDMAVNRASVEAGIGSFTFLLGMNTARPIAVGEVEAMQDSRKVATLLDGLVQKAGGDPVRMSYDEKKKLLKDTQGEDGKPLWGQVSDWYKEHPEYKPRLELFDTTEGRLGNWLSDQIWEKYLGMSALDRRMFSAKNPDFREQFASKETRQKPADIPNSLLEKWARELGGYIPQMPAPEGMSVHDQIVQTVQKMQSAPQQYRPQDPKLAAQYDEYLARYNQTAQLPAYQEYLKRLNTVDAVQKQYFSLPAGAERRDFITKHPELKEFWDWKAQYQKENPQLKEFFDWEANFRKTHPELSKLLGWDTSTTSAFLPFTGGGGGGGRGTFAVRRPGAGGGAGRGGTKARDPESPWKEAIKELGGPDGPLVYKLETWLTMEAGAASTYAGQHPDLAAWLATKSKEYLDALRQSYLYRLHHQPLSAVGNKHYAIRYLPPRR